MSAFSDPSPNAQAHPPEPELFSIGRRLVENWKAGMPGGVEVRKQRMQNPGHLPAVHGLAGYAHTLGSSTLDLMENGQTLEAMPLARTVYEAAITASWASQSEEGIAALLNEDSRSRRNLAAMARAESAIFREGHTQIAGLDLPQLETSADARARHFQQLCNDMQPGGADMYVYYRAMSMMAHPSLYIVDQFVEKDEGRPAGMRLLLEPNQPPRDSWLYLTVCSLMWAARAVDYMQTNHSRRSELVATAKRLGVTGVVNLTHEARLREAKAQQKRRRDNYKPPRKRRRSSNH